MRGGATANPVRLTRRTYTRSVVRLPADHDFQVVLQADQTGIEHPVDGARKRNAVANDIGAAVFDGTDMCRLPLRRGHGRRRLRWRWRSRDGRRSRSPVMDADWIWMRATMAGLVTVILVAMQATSSKAEMICMGIVP